MAFERWNRRFEGPFFIPDFLKQEAGVYVIWCKKENAWTILDVGEASAVKEKVSSQRRRDCWESRCEGKIFYSATYTAESQYTERANIERIIRATECILCGNRQGKAIHTEPVAIPERMNTHDESAIETAFVGSAKTSILSDAEKILFSKQYIGDRLSSYEKRKIDDFQWSQSKEDSIAGANRLTIFSGEKIFTLIFSKEELIDDFKTHKWQQKLIQKMEEIS